LTGLVNLGNYPAFLIQDVEGKDIERLYIEQTVFTEAAREKAPLWSFIDRWLENSEGTHLTVLGDYGTGKTWFTRMLAARLARRYKEDPANRRQPIRVDLRQAAKALSLENLFYDHFQRELGRQVNPKSILYLLAEGRFVLIFDAFDEMATQSNWDVTLSNFRELARSAEGRAKVILTCRTHYFKDAAQVREMVEGRREGLTAEGTQLYKEISGKRGFSVLHILDFNQRQIDDYIGRACGTRAGDVRGVIARIPRLQEIAGRPVLLDMIVTSAPQLARLGGGITVANLYEAYTEEWLNRQDWRLRITRDIRGPLIEGLAERLWRTEDQRVHFNVLKDILQELLEGRILTVDDLAAADTEVRTASFLTRDNEGRYGFSHRSFLEFFLARRVLRELDFRLPLLSPEVRGFMKELDREGRLPAAVARVLSRPYASLSSGNALLLQGDAELPAPAQLEGANLAGYQLVGMKLGGANLRKANLAGANLAGADCAGADFREADLTAADLSGAACAGADFSGANLSFATLLGTGLEARGHFGAAVDGARPETVVVQLGVSNAVSSVAFHPDGMLIAAGSWDGSIRIYDVPAGKLRRVLAGHGGPVHSVAWHPDGTKLASGSEDNTIRVWEASSGRALQTLE
ncbi:MAG: pentapeptide repeat-containing protein, partial [Candidatus Rokubacteria bacterium]|nr:pentapeptide repeat-containing protein [Candidatus Rokubacteria bacterium]